MSVTDHWLLLSLATPYTHPTSQATPPTCQPDPFRRAQGMTQLVQYLGWLPLPALLLPGPPDSELQRRAHLPAHEDPLTQVPLTGVLCAAQKDKHRLHSESTGQDKVWLIRGFPGSELREVTPEPKHTWGISEESQKEGRLPGLSLRCRVGQ